MEIIVRNLYQIYTFIVPVYTQCYLKFYLIYDVYNSVIWATNTYGKGEGPYMLYITNKGDLIIIDKNKSLLWSSNTSNVASKRILSFKNKEIGKIVNKSKRTIDAYRSEILKLTKTTNSNGLHNYAIKWGILEDTHLKVKFEQFLRP